MTIEEATLKTKEMTMNNGETPLFRMSLEEIGRGEQPESKDPFDWGLPGQLSVKDVAIYDKFQKEVEKRGGDFRDTVYSFGECEGEPYTLCRWLRARKFDYNDTIKMVEEATECRSLPKLENYYPDPRACLGVNVGVYIDQYPQLYSGYSKNGSPLFISKPGKLNIASIECATSLSRLLDFHWYVMMHDFGDRLRKKKAEDPDFRKFQCLTVMDLEGLSITQINSKVLGVIKEQAFVDSLCFPETMYKTLVINAPSFFAATWKIIKGFVDPRTAGKIEIISSKSKAHARLLELVDADQLPSDYGGTDTSTIDTLMVEAVKSTPIEGLKRITSEIISIRSHGSITIELLAGEEMDVNIHGKGSGTFFSIYNTNDKSKKSQIGKVSFDHSSDSTADPERELPTNISLTEASGKVKGPGTFKIKGESKSRRLTSEYYLIVCNVF